VSVSALSTAFVSGEFFPYIHLYTYSCELIEIDKSRRRRMEKCSSCEWMRVYSMWLFVRLQSFQFLRRLPLISITNAVGSHTFFSIFINNPRFVYVYVVVSDEQKNSTLDHPHFPLNLGEISNNDIDYLRIALSIRAELEIGRQPPFQRFLSVRYILMKWDRVLLLFWVVADIDGMRDSR